MVQITIERLQIICSPSCHIKGILPRGWQNVVFVKWFVLYNNLIFSLTFPIHFPTFKENEKLWNIGSHRTYSLEHTKLLSIFGSLIKTLARTLFTFLIKLIPIRKLHQILHSSINHNSHFLFLEISQNFFLRMYYLFISNRKSVKSILCRLTFVFFRSDK